MLLFETKKTAKESRKILTTSQYSIFKTIEGNRNISLLHLNRLRESMLEKHLFTVIVVNENMEIIDGQHRFTISKELNLPVNYVICEGYGLNDVHRFNVNSKVWGPGDYLEGYINLGYKEYEKYREFKAKYKFTHKSNLLLLSKYTENYREFNTGKFVVENYNLSKRKADAITQIAPYYEGFRRYNFIQAINRVLKKDNFDFDRFIRKLKIQPTALVHCATVVQYIDLIENIYNYKSKSKISLKY